MPPARRRSRAALASLRGSQLGWVADSQSGLLGVQQRMPKLAPAATGTTWGITMLLRTHLLALSARAGLRVAAAAHLQAAPHAAAARRPQQWALLALQQLPPLSLPPPAAWPAPARQMRARDGQSVQLPQEHSLSRLCRCAQPAQVACTGSSPAQRAATCLVVRRCARLVQLPLLQAAPHKKQDDDAEGNHQPNCRSGAAAGQAEER